MFTVFDHIENRKIGKHEAQLLFNSGHNTLFQADMKTSKCSFELDGIKVIGRY
jgi:hypothetical protein